MSRSNKGRITRLHYQIDFGESAAAAFCGLHRTGGGKEERLAPRASNAKSAASSSFTLALTDKPFCTPFLEHLQCAQRSEDYFDVPYVRKRSLQIRHDATLLFALSKPPHPVSTKDKWREGGTEVEEGLVDVNPIYSCGESR